MKNITELSFALGLCAVAMPGIVFGAPKKAAKEAPGQKPNVLLIMTDQQTATAMSCAGNLDIHTPNMDRLAQNGVRFDNAYCASPLSTPSRASMVTGYMPSQINALENGIKIPADILPESMGFLMGSAGYECFYGGKWHVPGSNIGHDQGFTRIAPMNDLILADKCIETINADHEKPFFMVASFLNPHNICQEARWEVLSLGEVDRPDPGKLPNLPKNFEPAPFEPDIIRFWQSQNFYMYPVADYTPDQWRMYRHVYFRLVEKVDAEIGRIFDALDAKKLTDNTIIIFVSDHGDGMGAHKWNQKTVLFEEAVNVPFIVSVPGNKANGRVASQLVCTGTDLIPTLCDIAGIAAPAKLSGKSLMPVVRGSEEQVHEAVVVENPFVIRPHFSAWAVRTTNYKYMVYGAGRYREQLFDMRTDRLEQQNLAIEDRYSEILNQHRKILREYGERLKDKNIDRYVPMAE